MEKSKIKIIGSFFKYFIVVLVINIIYTTIFVLPTFARYLKTYNYIDTIAFVGDVYPREDVTALAYDKGGIDNILHKSYQKVINQSDIFFGNLECAISDDNKNIASKSFIFKVGSRYKNILSDAGFDILTLANNHTLDLGENGLRDTIKNLEDINVSYVGVGEDIYDAIKPIEKIINGRRYMFFAGSGVVPDHRWFATKDSFGLANGYHGEEICNMIKKAKRNDPRCICIAYMHWGKEKEILPSHEQKELSKKLIDAGADLVLGSHPHIFQNIEYYKNVPIIYSLGNFIYGDTETDSLILSAIFDYSVNGENKIILKIDPGFSGREMVKMTAYIDERRIQVNNMLANSPMCEVYDDIYVREKLEN